MAVLPSPHGMVCEHRLAGWIQRGQIPLGGMAFLESDRLVGKHGFFLPIHCAMDRYGKAQTRRSAFRFLVVEPGRNATIIELRPV